MNQVTNKVTNILLILSLLLSIIIVLCKVFGVTSITIVTEEKIGLKEFCETTPKTHPDYSIFCD